MAIRLRADVNAQKPDDALDHRRGDLKLREAEDAPVIQRRLQIFLGVCGEPLRSIVAALNPQAALDSMSVRLSTCATSALRELGLDSDVQTG